MRPRKTACLVGLAMLALAGLPAAAQSLPPEQVSGTVAWISGGITMEEASAFKAAAPRYSLVLEFGLAATPRAEYLSNVEVSIADTAEREILRIRSDGPFLLAQLPPGTYRVSASHEGRVKSQTVQIVPGQSRYISLIW